jgi:hypothetical protein
MKKLGDHEALLSRILATLGVGTAMTAIGACGGSDALPNPPADAREVDDSADHALPKDGSPPSPTFDGRIPPLEVPDVVVVDWNGARNCKPFVVERRPIQPSDAVCPTDAGVVRPRVYACLPSPASGQTCEELYEDGCIITTYSCGLAQRGNAIECGPIPGSGGTCCYVVSGSCPVGRPFIVEGRARLATAENDPSWARRIQPDIDALDDATRAALADVWTQDALAEHASVASFSRFVLQCLSLGAPADIVQAAQQACADEVEHARIAFGLATAYAGHPVGPGRLDIRGSLDESLDLAAVACSVASEGCIAETVSATLIAAARDQARDPVLREVLGRIAEQEIAHALLAWRYLRWALAGGSKRVRRDVARVFARMEQHVGFGACTSFAGCQEHMRAHGYVQLEERRRLAAIVLNDVIRPAALALLAADAPGDSADLLI